MTTSVNIKRGDLHLALSTAFNRGRYVLMTAGDGQPQEITIDLRERPDDDFDAEPTEVLVFDGVVTREQAKRRAQPFRVADEMDVEGLGRCRVVYATDDHGASIPAQDFIRGPFAEAPHPLHRVYEFALQDIRERPIYAEAGIDITLANAELCDAPDIEAAAAADWVHVYDRVTRERRTLKRPEPDAVLTGLRDVAADLRKPGVQAARAHGKSEAVRDTVRGAPVEPPFGCAALPPVGPLTSVDGLKPGDVLFHDDPDFGPVRVDDGPEYGRLVCVRSLAIPERGLSADFTEFRFVGRPDASGWITWPGGENPVPGAVVEVDWGSGPMRCTSDEVRWVWDVRGDIKRFRIVDTPLAV